MKRIKEMYGEIHNKRTSFIDKIFTIDKTNLYRLHIKVLWYSYLLPFSSRHCLKTLHNIYFQNYDFKKFFSLIF